MQRTSTTVVALVGPDAGSRAAELGAFANVHAEIPDHGPALDRAAAALAGIARTSRTYSVHDADPLEAVVRHWVSLYDGAGTPGDLEAAVAGATVRWRGRSIELPDYYLVLDAETWPATRRHWYLGVLRAVAPARVVPVGNDAAAIGRALSHLPSGRWWPDLPDLLDGIDRVAPDAMGTTGDASALDSRLVR